MSIRPIALCLPILLLALPPATAKKPRHTADTQGWQRVITNNDRNRLKNWRTAWVAGLKEARDGGFSAAVLKEGALLDPDAGQNGAMPADGRYRCRTIKLGRLGALGAPYRVLPTVDCTIQQERFKAQGGVQRPSGYLWTYDGAKLLFLGAIAVGDETSTIAYGRDPDRNSVGLLDRIADKRWRLALPHPRWESQIDVIEIVPAD